MPIDQTITIPRNILLPVALRARARLRSDPDKWNDYEIELIRNECGAEFATVPVENVRLGCQRLRKEGALGRIARKGATYSGKVDDPPSWYDTYLQSDHWRGVRKMVLAHWNYTCVVCMSSENLEVHHRHYNTLKAESLTDCIPLCRVCHMAAHRRKRRAASNIEAESLMFR